MPLSIVSYVMMWYIPEGWSKDQLFIWFIIWHSIFFTVLTVSFIFKNIIMTYLKINTNAGRTYTAYFDDNVYFEKSRRSSICYYLQNG